MPAQPGALLARITSERAMPGAIAWPIARRLFERSTLMAGEVNLRTMLARPFLATATTPQIAYLLVEALPSEVVAQVRMPVNVSFVLDRSGSMKGEKIDRVRRATGRALEMLDAQDIASVVIFDHRTE